MIKGIGIDIVEINRINKSLKLYGDRFLGRTFTDKEIAYCKNKPNPAQHYAARFAAKEAFIKAVGKPLTLKEIEIERPLGKAPKINLYGQSKKTAGRKKIFLSISHDRGYAIAQVVIES